MAVSDLVIEILSRLPPESLLRCQFVCKSWYVLINDPKFVTNHLSKSLPYKHVLLKRLLTNNSGKKISVLSILKFFVDRSFSVVDIHLPFLENNLYLEFCGHSHGLVCLSDYDDIFLCNPMTRQFRKLPPSILIVRGHDPSEYDAPPTTVGFGYDAKSRDFKVVRIVTPWIGVESFPFRAEIYDLSKDKWREIEIPISYEVDSEPSFEMYHKGTLIYWFALIDGETNVILTFDMSEEVFGEISSPESFNRLENLGIFGVFNGSFVFFKYPYESDEKVFDIWKMERDEFAVVSWSKILTIGPTLGIQYPMLFVSSDELLMESNEGLVLYNCKTQQFKQLPIKSEKLKPWSDDIGRAELEATFFTESLVSIEGRNNISYEI